jgi:hypothetical protein
LAEGSLPSQTDLLGRLVRELERRPRAEPGLRATLDETVAHLVDEVAAGLVKPVRDSRERPAPKRINTAFVFALLSAPHFVAILPRPQRDGTVDPGEPQRRSADLCPVVTNEVIEKALGLAQWEIEELREEVDRRAGKALKSVRTVNWLWSYFAVSAAGGQTLGRVLFPGEDAAADLVRRGGNLYLVAEDRVPTSAHALYLPWLMPQAPEGGRAFSSRAVDKGLRNRIARGVGGDEEEVAELLEGMVAFVPRDGAAEWLRLDQWRTGGYAAVTDLGTPYTAGDWLLRPIAADGADWRAWLRVEEGALVVRGTPERVFDALALPRVAAMVRLVYAALIAAVDRDGRLGSGRTSPEDADLFDVPRHMRAALSPLLAWAGRSSTHKYLAGETGCRVEQVATLLEGVREAWIGHAGTSWYGPPGTKAPSIQTLVLEHLAVVWASLRRLLRADPDPRGEHGDLVLLFAAHYLREARLERLWIKSLSDVVEPDDPGKMPPPEDVAGHWFWCAWSRLLEEIEREGGSTTAY